ncbi:MAG: ATP-binding protein [Candidatus Aenigmarchaeota archaeon]|nr:ATP-binding protein [Candidatus Aenigmarchaeota archaeon]
MIAKSVWGTIIKDFQEKELPGLIEREIEYHLAMPLKRAIVVIGPRRAGKTYSMFQTMKKLIDGGTEKRCILYMNFEDSRLLGASAQDLDSMLDVFFEIYPESRQNKAWFFLDEIQMVEKWEAFVRRLLDHEDAQVFVTGSSSRMMSREIATSLRGRSLKYHIFPFSFKEFLAACSIGYGKYLSSTERARVINGLKEYMEYGGYPETVIYRQERDRLLGEIIDVTIYRDVIDRYKVKNSKLLRLLFSALFNSKEFSLHKFFNFLRSQGMKVSKNTLYTYLGYFYDSLVVYPLKKFSYSYKDTEASIPKIYFADNGLLHSQGIRDHGRLMENLVFLELQKKWGENLFYYRSPDGKEVDFVIRENRRVKQLVQACYNIENYITKEREINGLLKASEDLKCDNMTVITWDQEGQEDAGGKKIVYMPLWRWLLGL